MIQKVIEKRGSSEWTLQTVVTLILLVILLVLIVAGLITGKLQPLVDTVGAKIDSVLILFGLRDDITIQEDTCVSYPTVVSIPGSNDEQVIFTQCKDYNSHRCELHTFSDGSEYYFFPDEQKLRVKRNDSESYDVGPSSDVTTQTLEDKIYYAAVSELYKAYGVQLGGRREGFDIRNYIAYGLDSHFGEFGDLFVLYSKSDDTYFMAANGLYSVVDIQAMTESDLSLFQELLVGEQEIATVNPKVITPILTSEDEKWVLYSGDNLNEALDVFWERNLDLSVGRSIIFKAEYAICEPGARNSVYVNCHVDGSGLVSGSYFDLLQMIYAEHPDFFTREPQDERGLRDEDKEYIQNYLVYERNKPFIGIVSQNSVDLINAKLAASESTFTIDGVEYTLGVQGSIEGSNNNFPVLTISSKGTVLYGLVFNGVNMYRLNERDFFLTKGNEVMTPFEMYAYNGVWSSDNINVSREFSQSDFENALDRSALDFFMKRC